MAGELLHEEISFKLLQKYPDAQKEKANDTLSIDGQTRMS